MLMVLIDIQETDVNVLCYVHETMVQFNGVRRHSSESVGNKWRSLLFIVLSLSFQLPSCSELNNTKNNQNTIITN